MLDYIAELDQKGVVPKEIHADVTQRFPAKPVSASTLSRILKGQRANRRDGEAWSPRESVEGVDISVATAALAPLVESSDGRRQRLTVGEAQRITFVRRAAPDIPIDLAFRVAQMYGRTTPETVLDAYLAFAPWRGRREQVAYLRAIDQGWLPRWSPQTLAQLHVVPIEQLPPNDAEPAHPREEARLSWQQLEAMPADEREALEAAHAASTLDQEARGPITSAPQSSSQKKGGRSGQTRTR